MKKYKKTITLTQNKRGIWDLDTIKGCKYGMQNNKNGCYGACYAYLAASRYGYNFADSVVRSFENQAHTKRVLRKIQATNISFIRIGVTGDPSENWEHTIDICRKVESAGRTIVIITKHWELLPVYLYNEVRNMDIIINTSISALDGKFINNRLNEYNKLKKICRSVLRVVSCDFNINNKQGEKYNNIQKHLFNNEHVIDTVLRISPTHYLKTMNIINIKKCQFMATNTSVSIKNKNTHLGYCGNCPEMCGVNLTNKRLIIRKQLELFNDI